MLSLTTERHKDRKWMEDETERVRAEVECRLTPGQAGELDVADNSLSSGLAKS